MEAEIKGNLPRFCPDTKSAPHENALSQAPDDYAFLQIALEMRKRTAWIGGSITPLCSIDANFSEAESECLFGCCAKIEN